MPGGPKTVTVAQVEIVLPGGRTVYETVGEQVATMVQTGKATPLMLES